MGKSVPKETVELMIKLYNEGESSEKIAKITGSKAQTITNYLKAAGIEIRGPIKKFTEADKLLMVKMYEEGNSLQKIYDHFQITGAYRHLKKLTRMRTAEECHRIYPLNEHFLDEIDTEEKAYLLGFIMGDGFNSQSANAILIDLNIKDIEILYKFAAMFYPENPKERIYIRDRTKEGKGIFSVLALHSKYLCTRLAELGCPQAKTYSVKYPIWLPENLHPHLIRGVTDSDGHLFSSSENYGARLDIMGTDALCNSIEEIFAKYLGITCCNYSVSPGLSRLHICGNRQRRKVLNWLYKDATIYLERKYKIYLHLIAKMEEIDRKCAAGTPGYPKSLLKK